MSFRWTDSEVRAALGLAGRGEGRDVEYTRISTDSRTVKASDLFVALSGDQFDGHDFALDALERGAAGAVVSEDVVSNEDRRFYTVPDTLVALGNLAHHRRKRLSSRVVGITGSAGKTTTKDLLGEVLRGTFSVHQTQGNFNNRIGLPLTLLATPSEVDVLVLEMGTNEPGEIRALTGIAEPYVGVITTVSEAHLEKLGSIEGVMEEKLDLIRGLPRNGLAVVGDEPPALESGARALFPEVVVSGWSDRVRPEDRPEAPVASDDGCYRFQWRGEEVKLSLPGRHSVTNALLALAVAEALGVPAGDAARRIGSVEPGSMRSEIRSVGDLTLLVDCYNANPQSLRAALELLSTVRAAGRRVAVLGSMLELGEEAEALHRHALEEALSFPLDLVVATGLFADAARTTPVPTGHAELLVAPGLEQAREALLKALEGSEVVLLKASRGVAMESLIPSLESRFGKVELD